MSFKNLRPRPEAGFTLIEILLAIAILAMVAALVSVSFSTTMRLRDRALDEAAREHMARNTLRLISDELAISRVYRKLRWLGRNADEDGRPADLLAFSTATNTRVQPNAAEADVIHVAYVRQKDRLIRYSLRNPFVVSLDAVDRTEIADAVWSFNVRYFHKRTAVWVDQWEEGLSAMPAGVLIELAVGKSQQEVRMYTAWIPTPSLMTSQTTPSGSGTVPKP